MSDILFSTEDAQHHLHGEKDGRFVSKGDSSSRRGKTEAYARSLGYEDEDFAELTDEEMEGAFGDGVKEEKKIDVEKRWQDNDIKTTESFRTKVMPKLEKKFDELSGKLKIDAGWFREMVEMGDSPEAVLDKLTDEGEDIYDAFKNASSLGNLLYNKAEREVGEDDETEVEDAVGEWVRAKLQGVIAEKRDEIVSSLKSFHEKTKKRKANEDERERKADEAWSKKVESVKSKINSKDRDSAKETISKIDKETEPWVVRNLGGNMTESSRLEEALRSSGVKNPGTLLHQMMILNDVDEHHVGGKVFYDLKDNGKQLAHTQAKWYNTLLARCLDQTSDVNEAVRSADLAFSVQSVPLAIEDDKGRWVTLDDGQHVFVNKLGQLKPGGPSSGKTIEPEKPKKNKKSGYNEPVFDHPGASGVFRDDKDRYINAFRVDDIDYRVNARKSDDEDWRIEFDAEEKGKPLKFGITGKAGGRAVSVMRKIGLAIDYFLTSQSPEKFSFTADKKEESRVSLYDKVSKVLAGKNGYLLNREGSSEEEPDVVVYSFTKSDDAKNASLSAIFSFAIPDEDIFFAHDICNRRAQGVLNRSIAAVKKMNASARIDLEKSLRTADPAELSQALLTFIRKYRVQLADILTTTQLASLLEGAREVAKKIPTIPMFPSAPPPATLEPQKAMELLDTLRVLPVSEREQKIYELPADQQTFVRQGLMAQEQGGFQPPPPFVPLAPSEGTPERIHYPIIDEAAQSLAAKNVMTRPQFDALDSVARQKAFTVAHIECLDTMTKIRDVMAEVVRDGVDVQMFRERVLAAVDEGTFMSDAHIDLILRTNVQAAFSDGQMAILQHPFVRSGFPYASYEAIHDDRARHDHLALESLGIDGSNIYRINDPVFQMFRPNWDYNCRCSWIPMTVRMAASKGIEEAKRWLAEGVEPSPPAFVAMPSFRPPVGFQRSLSGMPLSIQLSCESIDLPEEYKPKPVLGKL